MPERPKPDNVFDPAAHRFVAVKNEPLGGPRKARPPDKILFTVDQRIELAKHAAKNNLTVGVLIANIVGAWLDHVAVQGEPVQLPLPTTDALNRIAVKARAARLELLDAVAKRNPKTPKPVVRTPKRAM